MLDESDPPPADLTDLARRLGGLRAAALPIPRPSGYSRGDRAEFWVNESFTNTYRRASATLAVVTPHLYMWVEDGFAVPTEDIAASADVFEERIYPTLHRILGQEWSPGIDGDPRLFAFNGSVPGVSGYFYSPDEYPSAVNPYSNEHEMFFLNLEAMRPGTEGYNATLAHELQHMIHWNMDRNEASWIGEGLSELAMRLNGFSVPSMASYLRTPDIQANDWPLATGSTAPHYGGAYLLMEYLLGRFGEGFMRTLVSEQRNGIAGIEQVLQERGDAFLDVFRDWTVANLAADAGLTGPAYTYTATEVPAPAYSNVVTGTNTTIEDTVRQFGADYIQILQRGTLEVDFAGQPDVTLSGFALEPGDHLWWSNRGDNSDMRLTREIDLSGVSTARLRASLWWNIEDGWDFAYAEVSADGGASWTALSGAFTQPSGPTSGNLGPAYTGASGGDAPRWVEETYSLDAYAGQRILLRFEYITDDSVNLDGFWIQDLEIPEIGWRDEGESSEGWQAEGFVRVGTVVPQAYLLTALIYGSQPQVEAIPVAADGRARATLEAPEGAVLIVSAATRHTRQPASYTVRISQGE